MLRLTELLMFLTPFVAFALWRLTAAHGGPSTLVLVLTTLGIAGLFAVLMMFSHHDALTATEAYVPARMENGGIVPGHGTSRP
ncbi:MAG: hypothetical protein JOZ42_07400 [Acetobacteraceae bacterium]|nr:hypothetical protein [Acetobacteraceae bacterium]